MRSIEFWTQSELSRVDSFFREREICKKAIKPKYRCVTHGSFREYCDYLSQLKNWCLLWSILAILPLTIALNLLGWVSVTTVSYMQIQIKSFFIISFLFDSTGVTSQLVLVLFFYISTLRSIFFNVNMRGKCSLYIIITILC